ASGDLECDIPARVDRQSRKEYTVGLGGARGHAIVKTVSGDLPVRGTVIDVPGEPSTEPPAPRPEFAAGYRSEDEEAEAEAEAMPMPPPPPPPDTKTREEMRDLLDKLAKGELSVDDAAAAIDARRRRRRAEGERGDPAGDRADRQDEAWVERPRAWTPFEVRHRSGRAAPLRGLSRPHRRHRRRRGSGRDLRRVTDGGAIAVEARGLVKEFDKGRRTLWQRMRRAPDLRSTFRAVDGIDLSVETGEIFGLLGPNGAGKTTTMRMISTLLEPTAGTIRVLGMDGAKEPRPVR